MRVTRIEGLSRYLRGLAGAALLLLAGVGSGCGLGDPGSTGTVPDPSTDIAQWNSLVAQYDQRRTEFLGTHVQDLTPAGNLLYWYDNSALEFALRRYDDLSGARVSYTFSVGGGDLANYRASSSLVVTAETNDMDPVTFHAWDATAPARSLGTTLSPKPAGAHYNAYAVDGGTAWILDTSVPGTSTLYRWVPGNAQEKVTTLESAGVTVGEFWDFGVSGSTMVFIESGRIWKLDLATNKATFLMNKKEAAGQVDFFDGGVIFTAGNSVDFFRYSDGKLLDLGAAINANPFKVNATYASASHFGEGFTRWKSNLVYIGQDGVFAYDWDKDVITTILLQPHSDDLRIDYRYPVALDDGALFVTGLTSTHGSVGADGPTYKLQLTSILK